jgi:hypothetical protein
MFVVLSWQVSFRHLDRLASCKGTRSFQLAVSVLISLIFLYSYDVYNWLWGHNPINYFGDYFGHCLYIV